MGIDQTPIYNLQAVVRETGLKPDVLRAWERRYNLPVPNRSEGGHRLYSAYDIETLKWLVARQAEGLSISRAVRLWREILQTGKDPLAAYQPAPPANLYTAVSTTTNLDTLRSEWLKACCSFDEQKAEEVLNHAFALFPVEQVCTSLLQQGLHELGSAWFAGSVSAQQEHFASSLAVRSLEALLNASPRPTRPYTVMIGCPPGEWHNFPVLLLALLLRRRGFRVVNLGANIPMERIAETAQLIQPDLVILSAQQLTSAASLLAALVSLQDNKRVLAFGGLIFNHLPALRSQMPGYFLGSDFEQAIKTVERLFISPPAASLPGTAPQAHPLASPFQEKRLLVELHLQQSLLAKGMEFQLLTESMDYMGNRLAAALELGSPEYMEIELKWVEKLLSNRRIQNTGLIEFLSLYRQAVASQLGEAGEPICQWIQSFIDRETVQNTF